MIECKVSNQLYSITSDQIRCDWKNWDLCNQIDIWIIDQMMMKETFIYFLISLFWLMKQKDEIIQFICKVSLSLLNNLISIKHVVLKYISLVRFSFFHWHVLHHNQKNLFDDVTIMNTFVSLQMHGHSIHLRCVCDD